MRQVVLIDKLTTVIPNKYEAVRVIAKEARRINSLLIRGAQGEVEEKPTVMALERLLDNRVSYEFSEPEQDASFEEEDAEE